MSLAPDILATVLRLPDGDRAELAHRLLLSLETEPFDAHVDEAWEAELERRSASIDRANVTGDELRVVAERMRRNLRRGNGA